MDKSVCCSAADGYGRQVRSMRLSVTQRCDLSCEHCHKEGQEYSTKEMSPSEISRLVRIASTTGVKKLKLTGGEPLLRDDIVDIVSGASKFVEETSMTTNGSRLSDLADRLKRAGLSRVNVSLHTLNHERFERLCGFDLVDKVVEGITSAVKSGLNPVKVNMVVLRGENVEDIKPMMDFCAKIGATLQLIEYETGRENVNGCEFAAKYYSLRGIEDAFTKEALRISENELHRRKQYMLPANGSSLTVEVVRPMHNTEFCANCTRIRMTSDGHLKPCLLDPSGTLDVLAPLRSGASDEAIRSMFLTAISSRRPYWR